MQPHPSRWRVGAMKLYQNINVYVSACMNFAYLVFVCCAHEIRCAVCFNIFFFCERNSLSGRRGKYYRLNRFGLFAVHTKLQLRRDETTNFNVNDDAKKLFTLGISNIYSRKKFFYHIPLIFLRLPGLRSKCSARCFEMF